MYIDFHNAIDASLKNARAHNTNLILRLRREEKITAGTARLLLARWTKKMQWAVAYSANLFPPNLQILYKGKYPNGQRTDHHLSEEEILAEDADNLRKGIVPQFSHKQRRAAARAAEEDDEEEEEDENFPGVPGDEEGPEYIVLGSGVGRASGDNDEEEEEEEGDSNPEDYWVEGEEGDGGDDMEMDEAEDPASWIGILEMRLASNPPRRM